MKTALMIIDTQVALFNNTQAPLYKESDLLLVLQALINKARSKNIPIIYIQHTESVGEFKRDTPSWTIHESISPLSSDHVIEKRSWDSFYQTDLETCLKTLGIKHLVVAGMQTEFCLDTTLRCGYSKGYSFTVIEDGHSTVDGILKSEAIINHHNCIWNGRFASVVPSATYHF